MRIIPFTAEHITQAYALAKELYEKERCASPLLPPVCATLPLEGFADNGLSFAALENDRLIGFLCTDAPSRNAFGIQGLRHCFSPLGANGTVPEGRRQLYAALYEAAAAKWVQAGAFSHGICLYAHDTEGLSQFFRYGFGARTADGILSVEKNSGSSPLRENAVPASLPDIDTIPLSTRDITLHNQDFQIRLLDFSEALSILPLVQSMNAGFGESPFFLHRSTPAPEVFLQELSRTQPLILAAFHQGKAVAFLQAEAAGETFLQSLPGYLHCTGMYCLPQYRGLGISQALLRELLLLLHRRGFSCLGTDFESFNPSGSSFWHKYFTIYTCGVVRRIDETDIFSIPL